MKKTLSFLIVLSLLLSLFTLSAFAAAPGEPAGEEAPAESQGPDAVDMFIYIAGGAVVIIALVMILIAYIKTRKH